MLFVHKYQESIKFSIIVPMYNASMYIEECIGSILQQNYSNYELIIVDDGSTDQSVNKCISLLNEKHNVIILKQKNSGPNIARNFALDNANSDYVIFIDADDKIEFNTLSELAKLIENQKPDFINYGIDFFDSVSNKVIKKITFQDKTIKNNAIFADSLKGNNILGVCWNKCINLSLLQENKIRFTPDRMHGRDILFSRQCAFYSKKVIITNKIFCHSRYHDGSFSRSFNHSNITSALSLATLHNDFFSTKLSNEMHDLLNYAIGRHLRYILILSAFRSSSFLEFKDDYKTLKESIFGSNLTTITSTVNNRSLKHILLSILVLFPRLCWLTSNILKKLNYQPY